MAKILHLIPCRQAVLLSQSSIDFWWYTVCLHVNDGGTGIASHLSDVTLPEYGPSVAAAIWTTVIFYYCNLFVELGKKWFSHLVKVFKILRTFLILNRDEKS